MESRQKKKRKKRFWLIGFTAFIVMAAGIYLFSMYTDFTKTVSEIHEPLERETSEKRGQEKLVLADKDPFSILLLGVDEREGDKGRSDTMVVLTVNPTENSTQMLSIPRDTYTELIGLGTMDKINHAYAYGGIDMSIASVENLLDIPIDYFVKINMEGFRDLVNAVGGIEVTNTLAFDQFPEGEISLTGEEAFSYIQMRKQDPRGDFGRQDRQKKVIQGIMREGLSVNSLVNYSDILSSLGNNVKTNTTLDEMMDIQSNYQSSIENINQIMIEKGTGETINKVWYYLMDEEELAAISQQLREHLDI